MKTLIILLLFSPLAMAQGTAGLAASQFVPKGSLPSTCTPRQVLYIGTLTSGTFYGCTATNTWSAFSTGGGGGDTITSPNGTITVGGTSTATTVDFNLGNANTWSATQTFPNSSITNAELANPATTVNSQTCTLGGSCTVTVAISTGVTGLGTGVATAMGNATNGTGGLVTFGGNIGAASGTSLSLSGTMALATGQVLAWNSDTGLSRASAGVIDIGNGTAGNTSGQVNATSFIGSTTVRSNSSFNASGTAGISGSTLCSATITYTQGLITACTASSDPLLKVFHPYKGGLNAIMAIHPIHFHWNQEGRNVNSIHDGEPNPEQVGFNAKNLKQVIPSAVSTECYNLNTNWESKTIYDKVPCDGPHEKQYLALPHGDRPIVAALVNAVQEQQAQIEELKREIQELQSR